MKAPARLPASFDTPATLVDTSAMPPEGEVLLGIQACGPQPADLLMANGTYQDTPTHPSPWEWVCGTVLALRLSDEPHSVRSR
jgi:NADPH2:quinone reductase